MQEIILFGAGVHSKVIVDIIEAANSYKIAGYIDHERPQGENYFGYPVLGKDSDLDLIRQYKSGIIAIGENFIRKKIASHIAKNCPDFQFCTAIHPSAVIGKNVQIGAGSVVMANAVINCDSTIGQHVVINTSASIDHDNQLDDFSYVSPGVVTSGNVHLGKMSTLCTAASVAQGIQIGEASVVGGGSFVLHHLEDNIFAAGSPAKKIKSRKLEDTCLS